MRVIFINGRVEQIAWREMLDLLRHPYTVALFLLGLLIFQLMAPASELQSLTSVQVTLFWAHVVFLFFGLYLGTAWLCERFGLTLVTPLLLGLIAAVLILTGAGFLVVAIQTPIAASVLVLFWLFLWALLLFFELLFVTFLLGPLLRARPVPVAVERTDRMRLPVTFVTGRREQMSQAEVMRLLHHPLTMGLTLGAIVLFVIYHPYPVIRELPLHLATLFWAHALILFFLLVQGLIAVLYRTGTPVLVPLALLGVSLAITLTASQFLQIATGNPASLPDFIAYWLFHWSVMVIVELLAAAFALDRVLAAPDPALPAAIDPLPRRDADAARAAPPSPPSRAETGNPAPPPPQPSVLLQLQGVSIPATDIRRITAEEHYLRIVTDDSSRLLRGRMADVEAQLPQELGLRVHRSHWVAGRSVQSLRRSDAGWTLVLDDRSEVPVARGRQGAVRDWLAGRLPAAD